MNSQSHNGWNIQFSKNIHMYCHSLQVSKDSFLYDVPCEDSPLSEVGMVMWLYELNLEEMVLQDLANGLMQWAYSAGIKYRLYLRRDEYKER
jgi:hypothetical protein